jgi:hypothetical protein
MFDNAWSDASFCWFLSCLAAIKANVEPIFNLYKESWLETRDYGSFVPSRISFCMSYWHWMIIFSTFSTSSFLGTLDPLSFLSLFRSFLYVLNISTAIIDLLMTSRENF